VRIARTRVRDETADAFESFVRDNVADVWRFVRRRVDGTADADDVTAEVFATAWRRRDESPPTDERRLWLFGVARLVLHNHRRAGVRRDRLHVRLVGDAVVAPHAPEPQVDDAVWQALASLGIEDRDLLIMRAWDGLAVNDIAVVLGISANAVSQRLATARSRLAAALEHGAVGYVDHAPDRAHTDRAHTDRARTGHAEVDPATAATANPPRHTEEHGDA
jgi:RNA polymerase sigma-70 factor (ECF subfamily)